MKGYLFAERTLFGHATPSGFGTPEFHVSVIPDKVANGMIIQNHYSRKVVAGHHSYAHFGVFHNGSLMGCLQFGYAMNPASGNTIVPGTDNRGFMELNRMWLNDDLPRNTASKSISYSIRLIKKIYPNVGWIQSFADDRCVRKGVVYQAANFKYYGSHMSRFFNLDGVAHHRLLATAPKKMVGAIGAELKLRINEAECVSFEQFRYIYWINKKMASTCTLKEQPYPKHGDKHAST